MRIICIRIKLQQICIKLYFRPVTFHLGMLRAQIPAFKKFRITMRKHNVLSQLKRRANKFSYLVSGVSEDKIGWFLQMHGTEPLIKFYNSTICENTGSHY